METKECRWCHERKPLSEFHKNGVDPNTGAPRYRLECKTCYRAHRLANRKAFNKFVHNTKLRTGETDVISFKEWQRCLVYFKGRCAYCGAEQTRRSKHTKEHVIPVTQGGKSSVDNIIVACTRCNCSKQNSSLEEWYLQQPFFSEERYLRIKEWIKLWQNQRTK